MFTIFPDSAVRTGDKWKTITRQEGEFSFIVKTFYKLKAIEGGVAIIESEGELASDSAAMQLMGYDVLANLKGEYKVVAKTGMLVSSTVRSTLKGSIQMMGREVPVEIESSLKTNGKKTNP
jgi:hypothetical protein